MTGGETKVDLQHLLEDIRDSYPHPLEEAVITELVANALDSKASHIRFIPDSATQTLTVIDNGCGMNRSNLEQFHDIAATTKVRGEGIGFAGVGVKLALLISRDVVTETRTANYHGATRWYLESRYRAPWEHLQPRGVITDRTGTAVTMRLKDSSSDLLRADFIRSTIIRHFYPLLDDEFVKVLSPVYPHGVLFMVGDDEVHLPTEGDVELRKRFLVCRGSPRKPVGVGFLAKHADDLDDDQRGVAICTYGKVIKRGWDWLGILPRHPDRVNGVVEVPGLAKILTTSKSDFLKDSTSLQKYYSYRKAILEAMGPVLGILGEAPPPREKPTADLDRLRREIERVVGGMLKDFPELAPLLGRRLRGESVAGVIPDPGADPAGNLMEGIDTMTGTRGGRGEGGGVDVAPGMQLGGRIQPDSAGDERGRVHEGHRRRPGLMIGYDHQPDRSEMGWLQDSTVWINTAHPAYRRIQESVTKDFYAVMIVAWVLSGYLEDEKSPLQFINRFMSVWGAGR